MNSRRAADHGDDGTFDNTSCKLVNERLRGYDADEPTLQAKHWQSW